MLPTRINVLTKQDKVGSQSLDVATGKYSGAEVKFDGTLWTSNALLSLMLRSPLSTTHFSTTEQDLVKIKIGVDADWAKVAAVDFGSLFAIKQDGSLWSVGYNPSGLLGVGSSALFTKTMQRIGSDSWQDLAISGNTVHGVQTDGSLWSWGNGFGSLPVYRGSNILSVTGEFTIGVDGALSKIGEPAILEHLGAAPPVGSVTASIAGLYPNVVLELSCTSYYDCTSMQFSNDGVNWSAPEAYSPLKNWTLSGQYGAETVHARFIDMNGEQSTSSYTLSTKMGGVSSAVYDIASNVVTLSLSCESYAECSMVEFSSDNANWSSPEAYASTKWWTPNVFSLPRYVYVRFTDSNGVKQVYSSSVSGFKVRRFSRSFGESQVYSAPDFRSKSRGFSLSSKYRFKSKRFSRLFKFRFR